MREVARLPLLTAALSLMACGPGVQNPFTASTGEAMRPSPAGVPLPEIPQYPHARVCNGGRWRCLAHIRTDESGHVQTFATPQGFGASDLVSAYALDTSPNPSVTIAIIGAYGYANAESDLAAYRSQYGLPACTSASGCFKVVNQTGQASPLPGPPPLGNDWTAENALDLDMASAACPNCKLVLVEADNDQDNGLFIVQQTAVTLGANIVSNSWGGPETSGQPATSTESYFDHPGISTFVATGDSGYDDGGQGPDYPGTSAYVLGVGGTSLVQGGGSRGWSETAWNSGGSACSLSIPKPSWQGTTTCTFKATSDVSAVGDPNTGLAVYNAGNGGWIVVGGTSAATPLVAGIFAVTGHAAEAPSFPYQHVVDFNDVTSGSNGTCSGVLCNAGPGWDGPTGVGTPNGAALKTCVAATKCPATAICGAYPDGCGGSLNCGGCAAPQTCGGGGVPNVCGCAALTACPAPFNCGTYPDGCGGMLSCGSCAAPQTCGGGSQANVCGCSPLSCAAVNATCGTLQDGCGGTLNCGSCTAPQVCGGAGKPNVCAAPCTAATCAAANATCGSLPDGCGGTLQCGNCSATETCNANQCSTTPADATLISGGCGCGNADGSLSMVAAMLGALAVSTRRRRAVRSQAR